MTRRGALVLLVFTLGFVAPAAWGVATNPNVPDFLTYRYAAVVAGAGGDPYDTPALRAARDAETGHAVVAPFLYPPPFLLGMTWTRLLSERASYLLFAGIQPLLLVVTGLAMRRWFGAPDAVLVGVACTLLPLQRSMQSGQVNVLVLTLMTVACARRSGPALALAAISKLSPALLVAWLLSLRAWRAVAATLLTLAVLTAASLLVVSPTVLIGYATRVLPEMVAGNFNDGAQLTIDLSLNHSLPNLLDRLWPSPDRHHLHPVVAGLTLAFAIGGTGALILLARRGLDQLGEAALAGGMVVILTLTPAIVWDDHFTFLALPGVVVGTALTTGRLPRGWLWVLVPAWVCVAIRPEWLEPIGWYFPEWTAAARDSKTVGALILGAACVATLVQPNHSGSRASPSANGTTSIVPNRYAVGPP